MSIRSQEGLASIEFSKDRTDFHCPEDFAAVELPRLVPRKKFPYTIFRKGVETIPLGVSSSIPPPKTF